MRATFMSNPNQTLMQTEDMTRRANLEPWNPGACRRR
jgi:hypothetical protein